MSDWWHADPVVGPPKDDGGDWWHADPVTEQPSAAGIAKGLAKATGVGLVKGLTGLAGLPGDAQRLMEGANDWARGKFGLPPLSEKTRSALNSGMPGSADILKSTGENLGPVLEGTGLGRQAEGGGFKFYEPQTTAERYAQNIGEFVPGGMLGPGGFVRKAAGTLGAGLGSEFLGEKTEGTAAEPLARLAGAVVGGALPSAAARVAAPLPFRGTVAGAAEHANAIATLEHEGVPVTAGQRSDRPRLQYDENDLAPDIYKAQNEAFTRAAMRRVGVDELATTGPHGTVPQALDRIGGDFDRLQNANTLHVDVPLVQDLLNTHDAYTRVPGLFNEETINTVRGVMRRIVDVARSPVANTMTGTEYQTLTSDLRRAARSTADPQRAEAINDLVGHLDDAMERSIARNNRADLGAWQQARRDYRNILVLERAAAAPGRTAGKGIISPEHLASAAKAVYGRRSYVRGTDDFSELAQAGNAVMKPLPDSGSSQRIKIDTAIKALSHVIGGGGGLATGTHYGQGVEGLLLGEAAAPLVIEPMLRGAARGAIMNPVVQHLLGNQAGAPAVRALRTPHSERLARALIQNAPKLVQ